MISYLLNDYRDSLVSAKTPKKIQKDILKKEQAKKVHHLEKLNHFSIKDSKITNLKCWEECRKHGNFLQLQRFP